MNQIFISSVQKELAAEREAVRDFIRKASERTALRDLDEMVAKGVFEKSAKSGRSADYLLASKPAINPP